MYVADHASQMHFGFVRDTPKHGVLSALGVYDPKDTTRETTRAVYWNAGSPDVKEVMEYTGARCLLQFHLGWTKLRGLIGALKFNALLEWLQSPDLGSKKRSQAAEQDRSTGTASEVEAPEPVPAEGVEDEGIAAEAGHRAADPEAQQGVEGQESMDEPVETRAHEEL